MNTFQVKKNGLALIPRDLQHTPWLSSFL